VLLETRDRLLRRVDELVPGRVVHDDADRPELITRAREHRLDVGAIADVRADTDGLPAGLPHERDRLRGHRLVDVVADDPGALRGEGETDGAADAVRGTGDEDGARRRWLCHRSALLGTQ